MTIHLLRAEEMLRQSRVEPAIAELRQHLLVDPEDATAHAMMARAETRRGALKDALKWADRAVSLAPSDDYCHFIQAAIRHAAGKPKAAESAVMEALRIHPMSADYHYLLAQLRERGRDWTLALSSAETGLKIDPSHIGCANMRAMALMRLGRRDKAESAIRVALADDPESAISHTNHGWISLGGGRRDQALIHFREALRLDPSLDSARSGFLETLRTRHAFYRLVFNFYEWIVRFRVAAYCAVIIAISIAVFTLQQLGETYPALRPFGLAVFVAYIAFVFVLLIGRSIADVGLRFHPVGRLLLTPSQRAGSAWVLAGIVGATISFAVSVHSPVAAPFLAGLCYTAFAIPALHFGRSTASLMRHNAIFALLYLAIAALEVAGIRTGGDPNWLIGSFYAVLATFIGYSWLSGIRQQV